MRYLAECPRCHTRLTRSAYLAWGIDRKCCGCHGRLKENSRYMYGWSLVVFGPGGVMLGLAFCEVVSWPLGIATFLFGGFLGYVLFPYVTKLELADESRNQTDEKPVA